MRKRIGLITICPEGDYQQRLMTGIFSQCEKYNYDVVVISPLVQVANYYKDYLQGELNIYELINFELFDGIIITPLPMTEDRIDSVVDNLLEKIKKNCKCPVVSAGIEFGDFPVIRTDDAEGFEAITEHLICEHGCRDIVVLTGMKDYSLSEIRVEAVRKCMGMHGLELPQEKVFYGDFWYTSGEALARKIIGGEIESPEAIICGSDCMAIGLVNELIKGGIRIPEDIKIAGYDARPQAALNNPPVTSYAPDDIKTGEECVNYLHSKISPSEPEYPTKAAGKVNFRRGETCGCKEDLGYTRAKVVDSLYMTNHEMENICKSNGIDIGSLMESYTAEILTSTDTPRHCIEKIYESKYLLQPYGHFYICLNKDWLNMDNDRTCGYSSSMRMVMRADMVNKQHGYDYHVFVGEGREVLFETKEMLPELSGEFDKPQVFYFAPLHFQNKCLGYAVLQNDLSQPNKIGIVYRNYLRNINNALEMSRTKNHIANLSEHDLMTGLLNRRGMELRLKGLEEQASEDASYLCYVIDMDGLKYINDNYGHNIGDAGILLVAQAAASIADANEICIRGGGDEFYVIGLGDYTAEQALEKRERFINYISEHSKVMGSPVSISASIGYVLIKRSSVSNFAAVLDEADVNMYIDKRAKKNRGTI